MQIRTSQINQADLATAIALGITGSAFSGNFVAYVSAGGWLGRNVLYTTGGSQIVSGSVGFVNPIDVPFSGGTGQTVSRLYVDTIGATNVTALSGLVTGSYVDRFTAQHINGAKTFGDQVIVPNPVSTGDAVNKRYADAMSGVLANGSSPGVPQNVVYTSGTQTISGLKTFNDFTDFVDDVEMEAALDVDGLATFGVTPLVANADYSNSAQAINVQILTNVSGVLATAIAGAGGAVYDVVFKSGDQLISGLKTFTGAITILPGNRTGHAVTLGQLSGASGAILAAANGTFIITNVTGTGTVNIYPSGNPTLNVTGTNVYVNPVIIGTITGNFTNISLFVDPSITGLDLVDVWASRSFLMTGYAIGVVTSGTSSLNPSSRGIFSGSIYSRDLNNVKTTVQSFTFNSGVISTVVGSLSLPITGSSRLGLDITSTLSGITKMAIGLFGYGTGV